jgi:hypothetical protein
MRRSVDDFFAGHEDKRPLYDAFLQLVERFGPVTVNVTKTRIAFQSRVRFAGIPGIRKDGIICGFWLKRRIDSPRFTRVEHIPPGNYVYQFKVSRIDDLDEQVAGWIEEAALVGRQLLT